MHADEPSAAEAGGEPGSIVWLRTNRGVIQGSVIQSNTIQGGAMQGNTSAAAWAVTTPALLCNEAYGATLSENVPWAVTSEGVWIASYGGGLRHIDSSGCVSSTGAEASKNTLEIGRAPIVVMEQFGETLYVVTSASEAEPGRLLASRDAGLTFTRGSDIRDYVTGLASSASKPERLYASAMNLEDPAASQAELLTSDDAGQSFTAHVIPLEASEIRARVLAVSPDDPNSVFVATQGANQDSDERLLLTRDAGRSFTEVFRGLGTLVLGTANTNGVADGNETAGASAADGNHTVYWLGNPLGLFRANALGASFEAVTTDVTDVSCLAVHEGALFVCGARGNQAGVFVAPTGDARQLPEASAMSGAQIELTLRPWLLFSQVTQPLVCPGDANNEELCAESFEDFAREHASSEPLPQNPSVDGSTSAPARSPSVTGGQAAGCRFVPPRSDRSSRTNRLTTLLGSAFLVASWVRGPRRRRVRSQRNLQPNDRKN
ncbi:MAG TPA: hypothetical protein VFQ61_18790 [Polyangiaceae bacterium]|nr:hypothetical protein [Polyangiaceae bacterium]